MPRKKNDDIKENLDNIAAALLAGTTQQNEILNFAKWLYRLYNGYLEVGFTKEQADKLLNSFLIASMQRG